MMLLVGKSGSGKDFFVTLFKLKPVVSRTTRKPRQGEIDGIHKRFITKENFKKYDRENVLTYTVFDDEEYCALEIDFKGKNVYVIDPSGVRYLKNKKVSGNLHNMNYNIVYIKKFLVFLQINIYIKILITIMANDDELKKSIYQWLRIY